MGITRELPGKLSRINNHHGAVLIFVALICVLLIALLGLALDSSLLSSGKNKQERVAEYATLAALEAYQAEPAAVTPEQTYLNKIAAAKARAEQVIGYDANALLTEVLSRNRTTAATLALESNPDGTQDGRIDFGVWYFADPPSTSYCGDGVNFSPCFIANTNPGTDVSANAVRITLRSRAGVMGVGDTMYGTLFARIAGSSAVTLSSSATGAFQPRRVVYAIDLSGSTDDESHDPSTTRSSFLVTDLGGAPCSSTGEPADVSLPGPYTMTGVDLSRWQSAGTTRSNYECFEFTYEDPDSGNHTERYLLDVVTPTQPLFDILAAINTGMASFRDKAVKGDEIGFIAYDHDILKSRRTGAIASTYTEMIRPEDIEYNDWLTITNTSSANDAARRARMMIIRRDTDFAPPAAYTNLPALLSEAQQALAGGIGYLGADNFIINFSDGLTNCTIPESCPPAFGGNQFDALTASKNEVLLLSNNELRPNNITFNMVMIGQGVVGAHSVIYKSIDDPNKCMSEGEIRRRGLKLANEEEHVSGWCTPGAGPDGGCFTPNVLSEVVKETGGIWAPVLNPCLKAGGGGACSGAADAADLQTFLNTKCRDSATPTLNNLANYTDTSTGFPRGRLQCNAKCLSRPAQIAGVVDDILKGNPYVLVESVP